MGDEAIHKKLREAEDAALIASPISFRYCPSKFCLKFFREPIVSCALSSSDLLRGRYRRV